MSGTDTLRPLSTSSIISPNTALEVMAQNTEESSSSSTSSSRLPPNTNTNPNPNPNPNSNSNPNPLSHTRSEMDEEIMNSDEDRTTTPSDSRDDQHQHHSATAAVGTNDLPPRYMVRAQFDFNASDPSALSFHAGDMIEVYTMLESGWWDGMLGDKRGWFPSNFVEEVDYDAVSEDQDHDQDQDQDGDQSQDPHDPYGSSVGHEHGLVGDELDRERDMRMLESEDFGPPIRRGDNQRDTSMGLGLEDVLSGGAGWGAGGGFDDLAREMMEANLHDQELEAQQQEDDGKAFEAEALRRRRMRDSDDTGDFGTLVTPPHRRREETNDTIKARPNGQQRQPGAQAGKGDTVTLVKGPGEVQDAWIPSLTPDGQVYYLNTHTGETSWDMPISTPSAEFEGGNYYSHRQSSDEGAYFNAYTSAPSSLAHLDRDAAGTEESFRLPPHVQGEIPYPWVSRMSDDGREWLYYNRITGQTRSDLPAHGSGADAISAFDQSRSRSRLSSRASSLPIRASVELQRQAVQDWEKKTRQALDIVLEQASRPTLALLVDHTQDALREVFEACAAGSAAEEEMSRAHDMGSESGVATAALREESARDMLAEAHLATMSTVRDLLGSFGYVGPLDKMEELPRPPWSQDVTLVGSIGLLSSNVHAAVVSRIQPASGSSSWTEVLRAATRLKDIVTDLPDRLNTPDDTLGKHISACLGIATYEILGGRWGFGSVSEGLRVLDHETVVEAQRLKAEFESALSSGDVLWIVRNANRFQQLLSTIDIASVIDVDGEEGEGRARHEEVETYSDLVARARQHLFDLDSAYRSIAHASADMLTRPDAMSVHSALDTSFRCLSTLLMVVKEQYALLSQSPLRGSVGRRSAAYRSRLRQRHQSLASQTSGNSRVSRASRIVEVDELRRRAKTMEQEYAEEEQQGLEQLRDRDQRHYHPQQQQIVRSATAPVATSLAMGHSKNPSASASQTSLRFGSTGGGHRGQRSMSATSSSTSLAFRDTESDSGSQKGNNRSSFMRFMKGRNSEDDGGTRRIKPSKKLAKLLGEDSFAQLPINNLPQQPAPLIATPIPERPWYLGEDYDPSEIVFDDRGVVKAGTIKALIARLTPHGSTDTAFFQAFLLTFRSFTSGDDLLDLLMERYHIQPPPHLDAAELADWKKQKQTPIRLRVVNTIRSWLDTHYIEVQDAPILERVEKFAEDLQNEGAQTMSKQLQGLVARKRSAESDGPRRIISGGLLSPPAPLLPRVPSGRSIRLLDISPVELARQLTIIESLHFQRIKAIECLNKAWAREDGPKAAPNVRWVILTANRMAGWVALQILSSKDVKVRASIMKYFVQTAIELRNLNNFSSMAGVVAGLNSAPITRLKRTKELLSAKTASLKANLDATLDSSKNFANYKDMLKTINPPCVPFFGFYLSALTFIEDGNKDLVQPEGHTQPLINFFKRSLSADILRDIHQYQSQPYNLARCKPVYDYICSGLEVVEKSGDLYEMSLVLEPREREEERIARMLHDSVSRSSTTSTSVPVGPGPAPALAPAPAPVHAGPKYLPFPQFR